MLDEVLTDDDVVEREEVLDVFDVDKDLEPCGRDVVNDFGRVAVDKLCADNEDTEDNECVGTFDGPGVDVNERGSVELDDRPVKVNPVLEMGL